MGFGDQIAKFLANLPNLDRLALSHGVFVLCLLAVGALGMWAARILIRRTFGLDPA